MYVIETGNAKTMWFLLLLIVFVALVYIKQQQNYTYWSKKGVAQIKTWLLLGNAGPPLFGIRSFTDVLHNIHISVPDKRYCGMYTFLKPTLLVRCPDLIKSLTVKEFDTFPEHRLILPSNADPLYTDNILTMRGGQRWRHYRSTFTPCLTTSKLKIWFELMLPHAEHFMAHLEKHEGPTDVNMSDAFSRYSNDVMCSAVLGLACNSFNNLENELYLIGRAAVRISPWRSLDGLFNTISPKLVQILRTKTTSARVNNFYRTHVTNIIKQAEIDGTKQSDVINLLINTKKKRRDVILTHEDITKQAFIFYFAGLNTSTAVMSYTIYELALNPDIQRKLQMEIDNTSELSYNSILKMKYLDMVVSESMRKWPPVTNIDRRSIKPFTIEAVLPGEKPVYLEAGTEVWISIYSLHRDPVYYPEPEKFNPERFNSTNRSNINQFAYLPFGAGLKNCIGSRFALLEVKLIIYHILSKYDIASTAKTPIPLVFKKSNLLGAPEGEFWIKLIPRNL